jgi:hypothetical protein
VNRDAVAGLGLLFLAGAYGWAAAQVQDSSLSDEVGATGLPFVLAILLAGLAVLLIARSFLVGKAAPGRAAPALPDGDEEPAAPPRRVLGLIGLAALYALLAPVLGYVVALALTLAGVAAYEGARLSWRLGAVALGGSALFWLLFVRLLGVEQPRGLLF